MNLPSDANELAKRWRFEPTEELAGGVCSRVFADDSRVLKVPFQGEELTTGRLAAERMSGNGGVRVHQSDEASGALLMDRLGPSLDKSTISEEGRIDVFLTIAKRIQSLPSEGLLPLDRYFPPSSLRDRLIDTAPTIAFIHGDLHHFNILAAGDEWLAIDPKGLVGEPAAEAAAYIGNPAGQLLQVDDLRGLTKMRIEALAGGLGVDPFRVWAWSLVRALDSDNPEDEENRRLVSALKSLEWAEELRTH